MRALVALHILLCPLAFLPLAPEAFEYPKALLLRLVALALGAAVLARPGGIGLLRPARDPLAWALSAWLGAGIVSAVAGLDPRTSLVGAHESYDGLLAAGAYLLLYLAARATLRTPRDLVAPLAAAALATVLAGLYAAAQVAGLDPFRWRGDFVFAHRWPRAFGTFGHANHLGSWLATAAPLLALPWLVPLARGRALLRGGSALALALALGVLVATLSRGGWLGAAVAAGALGLALSAAWGRRAVRPLAAALALGAIVAGGASLVPELRSSVALRASTVLHPEREPRWPIWHAAWRMARDHSWTGVGPDAFRLAYGRYRTAEHTARESDRTPARAHAELLHVAATQGAPGVLAALAAGLASLVNLRRAWRRAGSPGERVLLGALGAGVAGFAASVSVGFHVVPTTSLALVLLGAIAGLAGRGAGPPDPVRAGPRAVLAGLAVLLLAIPAVALPLAGAIHEATAERWMRVGRPDRARRAAERSVALAPLSPRGWAVLAQTAHQESRIARRPEMRRAHLLAARRAVERAVALQPAAAHHHIHRARILTRLARLDPPGAERAEALAAIDAALARDPAFRPFLRAALELSLQLGDRERAARFDALRREIYGR